MTAITDDTLTPDDAQASDDETPDVQDSMVAARLAGYSWDAIHSHLAQANDTALAAGYQQPEIDAHLGYGDQQIPIDALTARAEVAGHSEDADPSEGSVDFMKLGTDAPAVKPLSEDQRKDYSTALIKGTTKGPEDYAMAYGGAFDLDADQAAHVAAETAAQLPHPEDLNDYATRLAADSNLLSGDSATNSATVRAVRKNLLSYWDATGEGPAEAYANASHEGPDGTGGDPELREALLSTGTQPKIPDMSEIERQGKDAIKYHDPLSELQHIDTTGMVGLAVGSIHLASEMKQHQAEIEQMRANGADPEDIAAKQLDNPAFNLAFGALAAAIPIAGHVVHVIPPEVGGSFKDLWHDAAGNINVWHGTPHLFTSEAEEGAPFGRFKLDAIGSGEGNAVEKRYGIFLGGVEDTSKFYRDYLSDQHGAEIEHIGGTTKQQRRGLDLLNSYADDEFGNAASAKQLHEELLDAHKEYASHGDEQSEQAIQDLSSLDPDKLTRGHLYEVHMDAEPEHLLDWFEDFREQSPYVQERLKRLLGADDNGEIHETVTHGDTGEPFDHVVQIHDLTGEGMHNMLGSGKDAADKLNSEGIPGIKYYDRKTRDHADEASAAESERITRGRAIDTLNTEKKLLLEGLKKNDYARYGDSADAVRKGDESRIVGINDKLEEHEDRLRELENQPSREPTYNYVVHDPKILKITGRDGTPVPTPAQALGHVVARGMGERLRQLFRDVLHDDAGTVNVTFPSSAQVQASVRNQAAKDATRADLRALKGERNQFLAMAKGGLEQFRGVLNKGRKEHEDWVAQQGPGHSNFDPTTGQWTISEHQTLIDHMENRPSPNQLDPNSPLRPLADVMRDYNQRMAAMMKATPGFDDDGHINWKEDYYRHQHTMPGKASAMFAGREGSAAGFRERSIPYQYDALASGLKPVHMDPIENTLHDLLGKMDFRQFYIARKNMEARGDLQWSHQGAPEGMIPLTGQSATRTLKWVDPNTGEAEVRTQRAYAYPGAADAYNSSVGKGVYGWAKKWPAAIYDRIQQYNNQSIGFLLGGPIYHTFNMAVEVLTSGMSQFIDQAGRGEMWRALQTMMLNGPILPRVMLNAYKGRQLGQAWLDSTRHPALQGIVKDLKMADYRFVGRSNELDIRMGDRELPGWVKMIKEGDVSRQLSLNFGRVFGQAGETAGRKALLYAPRALDAVATEVGRLQKMIMYPVMEKLVPWVRNGSALMSMQDFVRRNPLATEAERGTFASKVSNSVDNRFGEMNLDNLFLNRSVRQMLQVTPVSLGWALGTYRAVGGGIGELLSGLKGVATGKFPGVVDKLLGEQARWLIAFPMGQALINSMLQYAFTGTTPFQTDTPLTDMAYFRTGGKLPSGLPARGLSWGYGKDWTKWALAAFEPGNSLQKAQNIGAVVAGSFINNPVSNIARNIATGKDWASRNIADIVKGLNHGKEAGALQELWYILKSNLNPMLLAQQASAEKDSGLGFASRLAGLRQAPKAIEDPEAYRAMMDKVHSREEAQTWRGMLSHENKLENPDQDTIESLQDALASLKGGGGGDTSAADAKLYASGAPLRAYGGGAGRTPATDRAYRQLYDSGAPISSYGGGRRASGQGFAGDASSVLGQNPYGARTASRSGGGSIGRAGGRTLSTGQRRAIAIRYRGRR